MREIKFRAWDKEKKQWIFDVLIENGGNVGQAFVHSSEGYGGLIAVKNYPNKENIDIMQFTGLKDRNGKEIYDGDILKHVWDGDVMSHPGKRIFVVKQSPEAQYLSFGCLAAKPSYEIEVVGNIYENSEILEKQ